MKTEEMLDIISEAESFIDRHSEPWYRSGQELLARVRGLKAALALQVGDKGQAVVIAPHALAGAAPVACVHPDTLALMRETPRKWKRIGVEPPCELRTLEGYVNLYDHAPAKAREVTDADVERALNCKPFTSERAVQYLPMSKPDAMTFMRAALATFAEGESLRHVDHPDCNHCYSLWADKQEGEE